MRECQDVRDLLVEHALGTLPGEDAARTVRHLAWCAACRKESRELHEGVEAATHLAPPVEPPPDLEDRVVRTVSVKSGRPSRRSGRVAVLLAAVVATGALGWGAAMADRAQRMGNAADSAREEAVVAAERFASQAVEGLAGHPVRQAVLRALSEAPGGGRALLYEADMEGVDSWALVVTGGLDPQAGPYRARLVGAEPSLRLGKLFPSAEGRHAAYLLFRRDVTAYDWVEVVDRDGRVVLQGRLNG